MPSVFKDCETCLMTNFRGPEPIRAAAVSGQYVVQAYTSRGWITVAEHNERQSAIQDVENWYKKAQ